MGVMDKFLNYMKLNEDDDDFYDDDYYDEPAEEKPKKLTTVKDEPASDEERAVKKSPGKSNADASVQENRCRNGGMRYQAYLYRGRKGNHGNPSCKQNGGSQSGRA